MSEMLGNQYFMGRKYPEAQNEFEAEIIKQPENLFLQKRLIICYTQTGTFSKAYNLFLSLIQKDIEFLSDSDPIRDDCPCPELVTQMESSVDLYDTDYKKEIISGILWSYCDIHNAKIHFMNASVIHPDDYELKTIIKFIDSYINEKNILTHT
jgi:hypothetical protein